MNKQLLILMVVLFTQSIVVYGQDLTGTVICPTARPINITCLSNDAFHPMPGTPYTYSISVPTPPGEKSFQWIVTQEQTFLTNGILNLTNAESAGGIHIASAGGELNSTTAAGVGEQIEITWKSFAHDPARPVFVVIYVENSDGCTSQNLKVFQIEPQQAFTLDIANLKADGTVSAFGDLLESCVSNIASAQYDAAAVDGVVYDYGTDYLFYIVNAAGYSESWQPEFQLTGIAGTQAATIEWAYPSAPGIWNASTTLVGAQAASGTVDAAGECIIVRISVKHNSEEVLSALIIQLAVDGTSNSLPDISHTDCSADGFANDIATHVLKPRPAIQKL